MLRLITRADDFGCARGANEAILEACRGTFIQNVSVMAVGPYLEEGVEALKETGACLGMHAVLNSEWDRIKWLPCSPKGEITSLLTPEGEFPEATAWFLEHPPELSEVLREFDAQLDRLTRLGLSISYVDMHMMPYKEIPGLREEMSRWIAEKGLIDHMPYYRTPEQFRPDRSTLLEEQATYWEDWFRLFTEGTYFTLLHPFRFGEDSLLMGNRNVSTEWVAAHRDIEYRLLADGTLEQLAERYHIRPTRYDEV
ncbi:MAG: ChbG/HpnK family deacetylase [Clostridia bacterium]|nr:ChbG/HpnK family deacetylase [Clostridia bacterium]